MRMEKVIIGVIGAVSQDGAVGCTVICGSARSDSQCARGVAGRGCRSRQPARQRRARGLLPPPLLPPPSSSPSSPPVPAGGPAVLVSPPSPPSSQLVSSSPPPSSSLVLSV